VNHDGSTEPISDGAASDAARAAEEAIGTAAENHYETAREEEESNQDEGDALEDLFPQNPEDQPLPGPLAGRFVTARLEDTNLTSSLQQVSVIDGKLIDGVRPLNYPHFAIKNKLLYQVIMKAGAPLELLLVPRPFISSVLQLAHSHMLGAHIGIDKTLERIKARFYWPGLKKAVEDFGRNCPDCQQVAPHPHHRNPLIPLPIISVPFSRIGIDLVGPLPRSSRGHQYIPVILDYATRYPEAIPLRTMATKGIARELLMLFSRVGIPDERQAICGLSHQGKQNTGPAVCQC